MLLKSHVVEALTELADVEYQKRVWLGDGRVLADGSREMSSLVEAGCRLYDDSSLVRTLDANERAFSPEIDAKLRELRDYMNRAPELFKTSHTITGLTSAEMVEVRLRARELLNMIRNAS